MARHLAPTPQQGKHYSYSPESAVKPKPSSATKMLVYLLVIALMLAITPTGALRAFAEETGIDLPLIYDAPAPVEEESTAESTAAPVFEPELESEPESTPVPEPAQALTEEQDSSEPTSEPESLVLSAQSDEDTTAPVLSHVYLLDAEGNPLKDSSDNTIDPADTSTTLPITADVHRICVVLTDEQLDTNAASIYVALFDSAGQNLESISFKQVGSTNDYEAILDGDPLVNPKQSLPEGSVGLMVVAKDTSGNELKDGSLSYRLICAELTDPANPFSNTNPPKANSKLTKHTCGTCSRKLAAKTVPSLLCRDACRALWWERANSRRESTARCRASAANPYPRIRKIKGSRVGHTSWPRPRARHLMTRASLSNTHALVMRRAHHHKTRSSRWHQAWLSHRSVGTLPLA